MSARVAVLDYGIGNLRSAEKALAHVGAAAHLVDDPGGLDGAAGIVLPGVGSFGRCARAMSSSGLSDAARLAICAGVPFLGICVGFQLLYDGSEESPTVPGLGILRGVVRRLPESVKVPQMQWNTVERTGGPSALLAGLGERPWLYFVHSFVPPVGSETVATCDYGGTMAAAAEVGTVFGTQFHPEKSGRTGLAILANFVARCAAGR